MERISVKLQILKAIHNQSFFAVECASVGTYLRKITNLEICSCMIGLTAAITRQKKSFESAIAFIRDSAKLKQFTTGSTFLNAESGIFFHTLKKNTTYIKSWKQKVIDTLKDDNKAILKAAGAAQKAADFILNRDTNGVPAFYKDLKFVPPKPKPETPPVRKEENNKGLKAARNRFPIKIGKIKAPQNHNNLSGNVYLNKGNIKEGFVHISIKHKKELAQRQMTAIEFSKRILENYTEIRVQNEASASPTYLVILDEGNPKVLCVYLKKKKGANYYKVSTAGFKSKSAIEKEKLLWQRTTLFDTSEGLSGVCQSSVVAKNPKQRNRGGKTPKAILNKATKKTQPTKKSGLKSPVPVIPVIPDEVQKTEQATPTATTGKIKNFRDAGQVANPYFYDVPGETGKFLQVIERKPVGSVVITIDGPQGAGKTTMLYRFMNDFAAGGNKCLFLSAEEHPESFLAIEKKNKYINSENQANIDIVDEVSTTRELYDWIENYEVVFRWNLSL